MPSPRRSTTATALIMEAEVSESDEAYDDARIRRWRRLAPAVLVLAGFAALAILVVVPVALQHKELSLYDEQTHLDYSLRVSRGALPRAGDDLDAAILSEWSCRGVGGGIKAALPACGEAGVPAEYPAMGLNYNYWHPPLYYAVTGLAARTVAELSPIDSFVTAARLINVIWLFAGLAVLYIALRELGVDRSPAFASAALASLVPFIVVGAGAVNDDATAILAGSVVLLVALRTLAGKWPMWLLPAAVSVTLLAKTTHIATAIMAVALAAWFAWRSDSRQQRARIATGGALALLFGFLTLFVWSRLQEERGDPGYANPVAGVNTVEVDGVPVGMLTSNLLSLVPPTGSFAASDAQGVNAGDVGRLWDKVCLAVFTAAPFALFLASRPGTRDRGLAMATLASGVALSLVIQIGSWLSEGYAFPRLNARYGLTLLPIFVACIARVAQYDRSIRSGLYATVVFGTAIVGSIAVS